MTPLIIIYFVPSIIALLKNRRNKWEIIAINFFLGFTVIGWFISLYLALTEHDEKRIVPYNTPIAESQYEIRFSFMNDSEEAFFHELTKQLPKNFYVFPKTRVADILKIRNGHNYYYARNAILAKHVDFLICDQQFRPKMAIEINGSSHNRIKTIESDELKKRIFEEVSFPLKVVEVGESFSVVVQEILASLNNPPTP